MNHPSHATADPFAQTGPDIPRDRYGRPLVTPPGGGKPVAYTRCTSYVSALEDTYNLERWKMRQVALGMADRPDLQLAAAAHRDDRDKLNQVAEDALESARAGAAATTGTALHALVDQYDRGTLDLTRIPAAYRPDIEAYAQATKPLTVVDIERFGVLDNLKVGGTWDRIYTHDGRQYIGDTKTGSIDYAIGKIAMQLAVYSRCVAYNPTSGERTPLDVDQSKALIVHLPAGQGECTLHWVDIQAGWEAVQLATQVRAWRKRRDLTAPFTHAAPQQNVATTLAAWHDHGELVSAIAACQDRKQLEALWRANAAVWSNELTRLASAHLAHLNGSTR